MAAIFASFGVITRILLLVSTLAVFRQPSFFCNGEPIQSTSVDNPCFLAQSSCQQCMQADHQCAWCSDGGNSNSTQTRNRCDLVNHVRGRCEAAKVMFPESSYSVIQNDGPDIVHQLGPQKIHMQLRAGQPLTFELKFRQAKDYPLDVYFLMDMSFSMGAYKGNLSNLATTLATKMEGITSDFRLGFGSFVDKPTMPYTRRPPGDTIPPCDGCALTYGFQHHMTLASHQQDRFKELVNKTKNSANMDHAEGGFDALMQAIMCKDIIGWRNESRKLIVFSTDAAFHCAGEGKLAAIVMPNDGLCHMKKEGESWSYTHSLSLDYPSVVEINRAVRHQKVNVIFAIANSQRLRLYTRLSEHIDGSVVANLTDNAKNIVEIVQAQYNKITSAIALRDTVPSSIKVSYRSSCLEKNPDLRETTVCQGLKVGSEVSWNVTLELRSCSHVNLAQNQSTIPVKIYPLGLNDELTIEITPLCQCNCQDQQTRSPDSCSGNGALECGLCVCDKGHQGHNCECQTTGSQSDSYNTSGCISPLTGLSLCSGRGQCICGSCECFRRENPEEQVSGQYCECDNYSCNRDSSGRLCGGHGSCECGSCQCEKGWSGAACDCPASRTSCLAKNGQICNGQGQCECGQCICDVTSDHPHYGPTCENCPTCPSPCHLLKDCVQCLAFGTGDMVMPSGVGARNATCQPSCEKHEIQLVDAIQVRDIEHEVCPSFRDNEDFCTFTFAYFTKTGEETGTVVQVVQGKVCPGKANLYFVVGGIFGSILFIGVVLLLVFKLTVVLYDRQQVAKFRLEVAGASWQKTGTPVNQPVNVAFHNASFRKRQSRRVED